MTETTECWLVFEQHSGIWQTNSSGIEVPSEVYPLQKLVFDRDEAVIGKMQNIADRFLEQYLPLTMLL